MSRRGAENLVALAELGAALRWVHPSDQALETEWESLLLDGIRGLEPAQSRSELVEGLRGLFASVAPTVVIWRDTADAEEPDDDEPACPKADAEDEAEDEDAKLEAEADTPAAPPSEPPADAPAPVDRARPPTDKIETRAPAERDLPARNQPGAASRRESDEAASEPKPPGEASSDAANTDAAEPGASTSSAASSEAASSEAASSDATSSDAASSDAASSDATNTEAAKSGAAKSKSSAANTEAAKQPGASKPAEHEPEAAEDQPALHEALFAEGDALEISQWHRQGFFEGLEGQVGCAQRIRRRPALTLASTPDDDDAPTRAHGRKRAHACPHCEADATPLAPGAPAKLPLARAVSSLVPLALWTRDGRTLPAMPALDPAPPFDEARAWDYDLGDRGTRLLAVLRSYSLLRRFYAHRDRVVDAHEPLRAALCAAAEAEAPSELHEALERLLAVFADGNAELRVEFGKPARRFVPPLTLAWVEERVVVGASELAGVEPGDVVTAIDGVAIDELLARELPRTSAANPSTAISRTVARLLARRERDAALTLELLRASEREEQAVSVRASASEPSEPQRRRLADSRPSKPLTELREQVWYIDPTRLHRLDGLVRLRRAQVVIVDLRGALRSSLLGHWLVAPLELARVRSMSGPDERGELQLTDDAPLSFEPRRPTMHARVIVLVDHRTCGEAELELAGFELLGAELVGSGSAGDLGTTTRAWLPGGWQLRFTTAELRSREGVPLWARGVSPSRFVEPTRAGLRAGIDEPLAAALRLLEPEPSDPPQPEPEPSQPPGPLLDQG